MQMTQRNWQPGEPRDLGNDLRLRWSRVEDMEALRQLVGWVFREGEEAPFSESMGSWVPDLMGGEHPLMGPGDFVLVEDLRSEPYKVVAATCFWHHTWNYEGIPLRVGRPEIVATHPDYRNRGLIRALFQEVHARSEAEGDLLQAITGIPYFYRQFGYAYALELGGGLTVPLSSIPRAEDLLSEPYALRDATEEDIPLLEACYAHSLQGQIVTAVIDEDWWRYQLRQWRNSRTGDHWHIHVIIDLAQQPLGYIVTPAIRLRNTLAIWYIATVSGTNVFAMFPALLRLLHEEGLHASASPGAGELTGLYFQIGLHHPVSKILHETVAARQDTPYAWYVRVPDIPRFLRHIAPALEKRVADSPLAGYTGSLKIDLYRSDMHLIFEQGKLVSVEGAPRSAWPGHENAAFPPLVFLQLLLGYRSLDELTYAYPDVMAQGKAALVLKTLFPTRFSQVTRVG